MADEANGSCFNFSEKQVEISVLVRPTIAAGGALACLLGITVIAATRSYRRFNHRLVLYLLLATLAKAVSLSLGLAPVKYEEGRVAVRGGWESFCVAAGFLAELSSWLEHMVIGWIALYFIMLVASKRLVALPAHEWVGVAVCGVVPVVIACVPFVGGMYGLAGLWCWIKLTESDCKSKYAVGLGYQFGLSYGPFVILVFFALVSIVVVFAALCRNMLHSRRILRSTVNQQSLKESMPLLVYPIIYTLIFGLQIANRVYSAVGVAQGHKPYFALWLIEIIVDPGRTLYPPLAFLLHPNTLSLVASAVCRREAREREVTPNTFFVVSKEDPFSQEASLIIRSASNQAFSDRLPKSIFDGYAGN